MSRKKALSIYLTGTLGQIFIACIFVFLLRQTGTEPGYTTVPGLLAIGIGGTSSALWGIIVSVYYKKTTVKKIFFDFINVRQSISGYLLAASFLALDFFSVLSGGSFEITVWYMPVIIFLKAILFGGIEEIGWRYTFQPVLEEKLPYLFSTFLTFLSWSVWHFLYFYIDGSIAGVQTGAFLLGLLTNCFILSALYHKTDSLWICVMTHALINTLAQLSAGGNTGVSLLCRGVILIMTVLLSIKKSAVFPS